jgi:hypothetical protein
MVDTHEHVYRCSKIASALGSCMNPMERLLGCGGGIANQVKVLQGAKQKHCQAAGAKGSCRYGAVGGCY